MVIAITAILAALLLQPLAPMVTGRPFADPQREVVGVALQQTNQSIAANPKLDTKETYELRAKMFNAIHNPNWRFWSEALEARIARDETRF